MAVLITTHPSADFDGVASMVAARHLYPEAILAFSGSAFQLRVDDHREGITTGSVVNHAFDVAAGESLRATLSGGASHLKLPARRPVTGVVPARLAGSRRGWHVLASASQSLTAWVQAAFAA